VASKKRKKRKGHYHTGIHVSPKAGECKYRSGWELAYMKWLDDSPDVLSYVYEGVKIPYMSNKRTKKIRHYYPDFLVEMADSQKILVEIKPARKVTQAAIQKKIEAARAWCVDQKATLQILTEIELKVMGLI
jgi:hypothetical protein